MSTGVSARIKAPRQHELARSLSQSQVVANKLRHQGVLDIVEGIMQTVESVAVLLAQDSASLLNGTGGDVSGVAYRDDIVNLCQHLKIYGAHLELLFGDQLNRAFNIFRNSCQDEPFDDISRLYLLEIIELRAKGWKGNDQMNQYYRHKIELSESSTNIAESAAAFMSSSPPLLNPGELIKTSGKFSKPTRIPGKNYCKDEVVIRNADSGKVMGIKGRRVHMIEELSETIISFQRVNPGAKERLVQITGANEDSINHSKQLIEETIRRNASPVRESPLIGAACGGGGSGPRTGSTSSINSSASEELPASGARSTASAATAAGLPAAGGPRAALLHSHSDASLGEYKFTVVVKGHTLRITGDDLDLVRTSKVVLDEFFSGMPTTNTYSDCFSQLFIDQNLSPTTIHPSSLFKEVAEADMHIPLRRPQSLINGEALKEIDARDMKPIAAAAIVTYSIENLARLAMSPLCLTIPNNWEHINQLYPAIVRKEAESFDVNQYLSDRTGELNTLISEIQETA